MSPVTPGDEPRELLPSIFADDDGTLHPDIAAVLHTDEVSAFAVVNVLTRSRLLVPVVAVLDEFDDASGAEKDSHMASVTLRGSDGRAGLLAFTSIDSLTAWNPQARPVPVPGLSAAQAAMMEADALIIDVAGPRQFAIDGPGLRAMAEGRHWVPPIDDEEVIDNVHAALALLASDGWVNVRIDPSDNADFVVVLELPGGGHPDGRGPEELANAAAESLARNTVLRARLIQGLQIGVSR